MSMLMPSPKTGLTFYALTPLGAYRETIPGKVVASTLMGANTDPARGGMPNRVPVPAERQVLRPWGGVDYVRLKLSPPAEELAPMGPPEDGPPQGRKRKKARVVVAKGEEMHRERVAGVASLWWRGPISGG